MLLARAWVQPKIDSQRGLALFCRHALVWKNVYFFLHSIAAFGVGDRVRQRGSQHHGKGGSVEPAGR